MAYQGHVSVGGAAEVRELRNVVISKCEVGDFGNNAYLLRCRATGAALLIDAAADPGRLLEFAGVGNSAPGGITAGTGRKAESGLANLAVVTTHRHADHWGGLAGFVAATGAMTLSGADDAAAIPIATDRMLAHADTVQVGTLVLTVIALRGHTPGSIALHYQDPEGTGHLFTGDSLFPGGVGKTNTAADFTSLLRDVEQRIFARYDDDTWFYPGHGDDSTLGAERIQLGHWRVRGW